MEKVHPLHLRVYSGRVKKKKRGEERSPAR